MIPARHIYPAAPLRLVAFEVQYGLAPALATEKGRAEIYSRLRESYPVADAQMTMSVEFAVGLSAGVGLGPQQSTPELVLTDRERTRSVTVGPTAMSVQTTRFSGTEQLEAAIAAALEALVDEGVSTTRRVGLRFVDELRAADVVRPIDWLPYVNHDLVGALRFAGDYEVELAQGVLTAKVSDEIQAVFRYGPGRGFAVDPNGRLRLPPPEHEPFFLFDIDTFWTASPGREQQQVFSVEDVLDLYRQLDEPAHTLFERAITDRARTLFQARNS